MSRNLYWTPVTPPKHTLPDPLKFALRKILEEPVEHTFSSSSQHDQGILETLCGMEVEGADELHELVEQHGTVRVFEN